MRKLPLLSRIIADGARMHARPALYLLWLLGIVPLAGAADGDQPMISIAIHGGAGVISRASMTPENERAYREDLGRALDAGYGVLESGGSSMDAVVAAVKILEDSPYFNAGKGAGFNHEGINELDTSIMDGATQKGGGVAGRRHGRDCMGVGAIG